MSSMPRFTIREAAMAAIFAALTGILSQFTIPIQPVPFSFAIMGAILAAAILPLRTAVASQVIYMLLGAVGVPVFAQFQGGVQVLVGPTGGYVIGFIAQVWVTGFVLSRMREPGFVKTTLATLCGIAVCYLFGTAWLSFQSGLSFLQALMAGVVPFVVFDIIKAVTGSALGIRVKQALRHARLLV